MWLKVDDAFLRHPKVHVAADHLGGRRPVGRIAAVWLECALYACGSLSDGYIPNREIDRLVTDDRPKEVIAAIVHAGLAHDEDAGVRFHDWLHFNPAAAEVKEKKDKDRNRKRNPKSVPDGVRADNINNDTLGILTDSERNPRGTPDGIREDSERIPERSRARDPVPSPKDQDPNIKPTAARASVRARSVA